jgi:hypothetical protein
LSHPEVLLRHLLPFVLLVACQSGAPRDSLIRNPLDPFPQSLADVGLYPDLSDLTQVTPEAEAYEPQWPLWTNGSSKDRYIIINGDTTPSDPPVFPVGTLFFKTFGYADGPAETRVMRLSEDGWEYGTYVWDGNTATLTDGRTLVTVDRTNANGDAVEHTVPVTLQCRTCHESSPSATLGYSPEQLEGPAIDSGDPLEDAFLALLQANCVHCHNGSDAPSASFDMRPDIALENLIGVPTQGSASASGIRVVAGDPQASVLYQAMAGTSDDAEVAEMPPLGVDLRDDAGLDIVIRFIESLESP